MFEMYITRKNHLVVSFVTQALVEKTKWNVIWQQFIVKNDPISVIFVPTQAGERIKYVSIFKAFIWNQDLQGQKNLTRKSLPMQIRRKCPINRLSCHNILCLPKIYPIICILWTLVQTIWWLWLHCQRSCLRIMFLQHHIFNIPIIWWRTNHTYTLPKCKSVWICQGLIFGNLTHNWSQFEGASNLVYVFYIFLWIKSINNTVTLYVKSYIQLMSYKEMYMICFSF